MIDLAAADSTRRIRSHQPLEMEGPEDAAIRRSAPLSPASVGWPEECYRVRAGFNRYRRCAETAQELQPVKSVTNA